MIGNKLKLLRGDKTQDEVANALGIKRARYALYEQGRNEPNIDMLKKMSKYFKVPIDYLINSDIKEPLEKIEIGKQIKIPILGTVKAGPNGLAYEDFLGIEEAEKDDINGGNYFYLKVKGESMINDGILPGDLVLVREQPDIDYGDLAVVIVNGEEGTLKRVYKKSNSIILQSSNPEYPPRIFEGKDMEQIRIVGKVKALKRKF